MQISSVITWKILMRYQCLARSGLVKFGVNMSTNLRYVHTHTHIYIVLIFKCNLDGEKTSFFLFGYISSFLKILAKIIIIRILLVIRVINYRCINKLHTQVKFYAFVFEKWQKQYFDLLYLFRVSF